MSSGEESLEKKKKKHKRRKEKKKIDSGLVSCFGRIGVPARSVNFFGPCDKCSIDKILHFNYCLAIDSFKRRNCVANGLYQPYMTHIWRSREEKFHEEKYSPDYMLNSEKTAIRSYLFQCSIYMS